MTTFQDTCHHGKMTKVDRYKWKIQDKPGRMQMIDKLDLEIEEEYQRDGMLEKNIAKSREIASEWSWIACGVIVVAERNGRRYVVDGQHRVNAARMRSDIQDLPCIVFRSHGIEEEALGWLTIQTKRKPVTSFEKFKALIAIKDPAAVMVKDLVESAGLTMDRTGTVRTVACVTAMLTAARNRGDILRRVWPLIALLCSGTHVTNILVKALVHIERKMPEGQSLTDPAYSRRLMKIGAEGLLDAAKRAAVYHENGTAEIWAAGMVEAINKGHRNRLELRK
jgi:hypothetical protein